MGQVTLTTMLHARHATVRNNGIESLEVIFIESFYFCVENKNLVKINFFKKWLLFLIF